MTGSIPFALGLLAAWLCCSLPDRPGFANEFPRQFERATIIHFEGEITQQQFKFFESKLKLAERRSSDLVIIVIDSPGGLLQQSLSIGERLRDVDWATTIAYVPQKAISGAAIFALGCDRIVMGENARLGDAGVIELNENFLFQYVEAKLLTDVVRQVRDLATSKSRSPDLAEALVDRSAVVYQRIAEDGESREFKIQYAEKAKMVKWKSNRNRLPPQTGNLPGSSSLRLAEIAFWKSMQRRGSHLAYVKRPRLR